MFVTVSRYHSSLIFNIKARNQCDHKIGKNIAQFLEKVVKNAIRDPEHLHQNKIETLKYLQQAMYINYIFRQNLVQ